MKKLILALAAGLMVGWVSAQPATVLEPAFTPLDPALLKTIRSASTAFELRTLSIEQSKELLSSTEGEVWRVRSVQGPACENPKAKGKSAQKQCRQLKTECRKADAFAHAYSQHATCSALYEQTTVQLSNDGDGRHAKITRETQAKEAAKAARLKHKTKTKALAPHKRNKPVSKPLVHDTRC